MIREKAIEVLGAKNSKLAGLITDNRVLASIPVMESLSKLSKQELDLIFDAASKYGSVCRIFYSKEDSGVPGENVMIKDARKPSSKRVYPLMPIKRLPVFDPDAEISSLALTIPFWMESIKRKCKSTDFDSATFEAKNHLVYELTLLTNLCFSIIKEIRSCETNAEK